MVKLVWFNDLPEILKLITRKSIIIIIIIIIITITIYSVVLVKDLLDVDFCTE